MYKKKLHIFVLSVLAKPLNNAQIVRGVFCLLILYPDSAKRPDQAYYLTERGLELLKHFAS